MHEKGVIMIVWYSKVDVSFCNEIIVCTLNVLSALLGNQYANHVGISNPNLLCVCNFKLTNIVTMTFYDDKDKAVFGLVHWCI